MDARGIDEYVLGVSSGEHPAHRISSRLGMRASDGDGLADQRIEQRTLSDVRPADERHATRPILTVGFVAQRVAAPFGEGMVRGSLAHEKWNRACPVACSCCAAPDL